MNEILNSIREFVVSSSPDWVVALGITISVIIGLTIGFIRGYNKTEKKDAKESN